MACHKGDAAIAGFRVDQLTGAMDEAQMESWERVYRRVADGSMPVASGSSVPACPAFCAP